MLEHLKQQYGFNSFRPLQQESIDATIRYKDSIVLFPTGGGKSLCYQFPSTYLNKVTVVVSPLISLMADQQNSLTQLDIKSLTLNSTNTSSDFELLEQLEEVSIIYCTPEYITRNSTIIETLKNMHVCMFAIDEAHCLSEWGHDFRPSYRKLAVIRTEFPTVPIAAFTATATPRVIKDIAKVLNLKDELVLQKSSKRPNLKLSVWKKSNPSSDLLPLLGSGPTIIYVQTRDMTEKISSMLNDNGINAANYHAGMSNADRHKNHTLFITDKIQVLVATISFGMGIDKADIRTVIIYGASTDIETYYQEVGRAGRDGVVSNGILFHAPSDFTTNRLLLSKSQNSTYRNGLLKMFKQYIDNVNGLCRQYMIEHYFRVGKLPENGPTEADKCLCDVCTGSGSEPTSTPVAAPVDLTSEAKMVVGLVNSLRADYGGSKLSMTLVGSTNRKLSKELLDSRYHGQGDKRSMEWWKLFIDLLIREGYLANRMYMNKYPLVVSGSKSPAGPGSVMLTVSQDMQLLAVDQGYLDSLRRARSDIAQQEQVAPYMVLSDAVLLRIAEAKPKTLDDLRAVNGITNILADKHGSKFIGTKSKIDQSVPVVRNATGSSSKESLTLYKQGKSLNDIAKCRNLKPATIENHLIAEWTQTPHEIDCERLGITQDVYDSVVAAIESVGLSKLKPIKEIVDDSVSYFQIKACIVLYNDSKTS